MIHFYDASTPENVPSGVYAAVYINGQFAWPQEQVKRMERVISISVRSEAHWAIMARVLDIERGAASVSDLVPFVRARRELGYDDATAYVDREDLPACKAEVAAAGLRCRFWVATLDGTQDIDEWAVQYQGGQDAPYDLSILRGVNDFHRP
jgi:hypothetical protein